MEALVRCVRTAFEPFVSTCALCSGEFEGLVQRESRGEDTCSDCAGENAGCEMQHYCARISGEG